MFIALVSFMNGLNENGLMLNRTPHILLYNEVKPSENQPLGLSEDYKRNANFIRSIKPKDRGNQYTTVCRLLRP
jgi:lipoprotein-releasing system permease protein